MTESPFPFGAVDDSPLPDDPEAGSRRNLLALGALAAVVIAGGAFFLLSGGDEAVVDDVAFSPRPPRVVSTQAPRPKPVKLPVATAVDLGRNPFKALYVQPAAATVSTGTAPAAGVPGTSPATSPIVVVGPAPIAPAPTAAGPGTGTPGTGTPGTGSGGAAPAPVAEEHQLVLTRVTGDGGDLTAHFTVDAKRVTAAVGDTFGPGHEIKLVSLQGGPQDGQWTAVLQVGDGDPFDVVTGQRVYVR